MSKPDLVNGNAEDIRRFVVAVTGLAYSDHANKNSARSGAELVDKCAEEWRIFHKRMASGIYNMTRRTLEHMDNPNAP